jgi:hypothetical protein
MRVGDVGEAKLLGGPGDSAKRSRSRPRTISPTSCAIVGAERLVTGAFARTERREALRYASR